MVPRWFGSEGALNIFEQKEGPTDRLEKKNSMNSAEFNFSKYFPANL